MKRNAEVAEKGGKGDVFQGDDLGVNDGGLVIHVLAAGRVFGLGELHLGDPVASVCDRRCMRGYWGEHLFHRSAGMTGDGLVVQMPMGELVRRQLDLRPDDN